MSIQHATSACEDTFESCTSNRRERINIRPLFSIGFIYLHSTTFIVAQFVNMRTPPPPLRRCLMHETWFRCVLMFIVLILVLLQRRTFCDGGNRTSNKCLLNWINCVRNKRLHIVFVFNLVQFCAAVKKPPMKQNNAQKTHLRTHTHHITSHRCISSTYVWETDTHNI